MKIKKHHSNRFFCDLIGPPNRKFEKDAGGGKKRETAKRQKLPSQLPNGSWLTIFKMKNYN